MKKLLLILLPSMMFSQVGIQTQTFLPGEIFRVAGGTVTYENIPTISTAQYVMVTDSEGRQMKMLLSSLIIPPSTCPTLLRNESNGYYLKFSSTNTIPNPNNAVTVNGVTWAFAGTYNQNNLHYYSYTNLSGVVLNLNNNFTVMFSTQQCIYTP